MRVLPRLRPQYNEASWWHGVLVSMAPDFTASEWAEKIGCSAATVRRFCKRHGLKVRYRP